jgi:hypothetical protein
MPRSPTGENSEAPAFGRSAREEGLRSSLLRSQGKAFERSCPTTGTEKALKGRRSGGHRPRDGFGRPRHGLSGEIKALKTADPSGA